jgi:histidinol phosphatase-like PHP family hydrolase
VIDLHCHTLFSDGELLPSELVQRAEAMGHRGLAITDHVDLSNLDFVLPRVKAVVQELNRHHQVKALAGVELTHVPPATIADLTSQARELGAQIILVHGETLVEPVAAGTNQAALEAGVDILAHPGLITPEQAALAAKKGVLLEISARKGHCLANGHVLRMAEQAGAKLVVNTDAHAPSDLIDRAQAEAVALGAGVSPERLPALFEASEEMLNRALAG